MSVPQYQSQRHGEAGPQAQNAVQRWVMEARKGSPARGGLRIVLADPRPGRGRDPKNASRRLSVSRLGYQEIHGEVSA
jgi:hypothetical protein